MSSRRVILNTTASYIRSVISVGLALFSSRWVLTALGQTDFGLLFVVGSLIVCVAFLNSVLGVSVARYFSYALGKGECEDVNHWFNTALVIHLLMPTVLILVGWPIGEYCLKYVLTIPPERVLACLWVFRLSLISTFLSMSGVPFLAMFFAKQQIAEIAFWGFLQTLLTFSLAFFIGYMPGDRLVIYSGCMVLIASLMILIQIARAAVIFKECRIKYRYWFDGARTKELFTFSAWNIIGTMGSMLRSQGNAFMLNLFYEPKINAAFGIANQVSMQANVLSEAMSQAMSPEITAAAGRGDSHRLHALSLQASKFGFLLAMLISIPLWIEMENVLQLWLCVPPEYTVVFTRITIITFLVDKTTTGNMIAINAKGKIGAYQATVGVVMLLTLPLSYFMLKFLQVPSAALYAILITSVGCSIGRVLWGRALLGHAPNVWVVSVLWRCLIVGIPVAVLAILPHLLMQPSILRLFTVFSVSACSVAVFGWVLGLTCQERTFFILGAESVLAKNVPLLPSSIRLLFKNRAVSFLKWLNFSSKPVAK